MSRMLTLWLWTAIAAVNLSLGEISEEGVNQKKVQNLANLAVDSINDGSTANYRSKLVHINYVGKEVVTGGTVYNVDIVIAETECSKKDPRKIEECHYSEDGTKEICSIKIREIMWKNNLEVVHKSCGPLKPTIPYKVDFDAFRVKFNKTYGKGSEEYKLRYETYLKNMETAALMNEYEQGTATYGETIFSDMTYGEFKKFYTGGGMAHKYNRMMKQAQVPSGKIPDSFDWRDHSVVTPVKDQGHCGSCWAFSTTGNIESQWAIKKGQLVPLSEQELVDCDNIDLGCKGGDTLNAYTAIMKLGGLEAEEDYPYLGKDNNCTFDKSKVKVTITGGVKISSNETEMAAWLYHNGPFSIGINAFAMMFYSGGIAHPWKLFCLPAFIDHAVLIVGYDVSEEGIPYWIIKNSWSTKWGVQGYYLAYRGGGVCGLNKECTSAVVG